MVARQERRLNFHTRAPQEAQTTGLYLLYVAGENDEIYVILRKEVEHAGSCSIFVSFVISRW